MTSLSPPHVAPRRAPRFLIKHLVVMLWFVIFIGLLGLWAGYVYALLNLGLLLPLYWQAYVTIKEDINELRERAGIPREPAAWEAADTEGDKPERPEE